MVWVIHRLLHSLNLLAVGLSVRCKTWITLRCKTWITRLAGVFVCVITELSSYPGYFWEPRWFSMGCPEISRVTWQVWVQCILGKLQCIVGSCDQWEFPTFFRGYWLARRLGNSLDQSIQETHVDIPRPDDRLVRPEHIYQVTLDISGEPHWLSMGLPEISRVT